MPEPILRAAGLTKIFGGLAAVRDLSLELWPDRIHAVIGPNGAGKTTLINLLSGDLAPSAGAIFFHGQPITAAPLDRIARLGIARAYQRTNIFADFSVFENCRLAAQARGQQAIRLFRPALAYRAINEAAERALSLAGLTARASHRAAELSHGEQRQLEVAMALATEPTLLLLDEPLAGMGPEEAARITALIARLGADHAILLVEHDMDAVFNVAATVTVMVDGTTLASGSPDAIRANAAVQAAYLGEVAT
ncbi:MAG TPA: ABC transporter ATP-binding protein [Stellaceae bacterium]|jgi:branched-chain amino acid transport system ATP-binding protein|nr:ABC transporter ATP-binding protein [Stellaceae bacterium]